MIKRISDILNRVAKAVNKEKADLYQMQIVQRKAESTVRIFLNRIGLPINVPVNVTLYTNSESRYFDLIKHTIFLKYPVAPNPQELCFAAVHEAAHAVQDLLMRNDIYNDDASQIRDGDSGGCTFDKYRRALMQAGVEEGKINEEYFDRFLNFLDTNPFVQKETFPLLAYDNAFYVHGKKGDLLDSDAIVRNTLYSCSTAELMSNYMAANFAVDWLNAAYLSRDPAETDAWLSVLEKQRHCIDFAKDNYLYGSGAEFRVALSEQQKELCELVPGAYLTTLWNHAECPMQPTEEMFTCAIELTKLTDEAFVWREPTKERDSEER